MNQYTHLSSAMMSQLLCWYIPDAEQTIQGAYCYHGLTETEENEKNYTKITQCSWFEYSTFTYLRMHII